MGNGVVKTVILCGGQGTRIRGVADDIPKPMIPIGDQPVLWHIMQLYSRHGINDFVLCLGHKGAAITGELAQTGARLLRVRKYLADSELFCFTYGDGVSDIDICELISFHRAHGRIATVTGVRPPGRFGVMRTTSKHDITLVEEFLEKPQTEQGWINGGFFVLDHRIWNYLSEEEDLIFEREPLQRLSRDGQLVMYEHRGFWQPMDTYREWKLLNELWRSGHAPWNCKPCLQTLTATK
jgi:glucose-1-phosphate cytidylyltransferase